LYFEAIKISILQKKNKGQVAGVVVYTATCVSSKPYRMFCRD